MPVAGRPVGHVALGTWSGGRYLHFGEPVAEDRLEALLRPGDGIDTVLTADAYGSGAADELLGRALRGVDRSSYTLVGAIGHDFYTGKREGPKGFPRFTDPRLREASEFAAYIEMAVQRQLERLGVDQLDVLLLHNPDLAGYTSAAVWDGLQAVKDAGMVASLGVAPGPANGFTLDVIRCFELFGDRIDLAMLILNPFEPWPGELALQAAARHEVDVLARVVDYGGLFWGDVAPGHTFAERDHRLFRPDGWVEAGVEKLERVRPIAERHGLTPIQLAAQWVLAHEPVVSVAPTLIQEVGGRPIEDKRAELAATPRDVVLSADEVAEIRGVGDNTGCMALKGATPDHEGEALPDRWAVLPELVAVGERWGIDPDRQLRRTM